MRQPLVVGNWKMNGRLGEAEELARAIAGAEVDWEHVSSGICPPFPLIDRVASAVQDSPVGWGAQNLHQEDSGAFTGEVAGPLLKDLGCTYVIVGHSERRDLFGESNELVAEKFFAAKRNGLIPILCVGETEAERDAGKAGEVVREQVQAVLGDGKEDVFRDAVIAYEPVWAIGTGRTATPEQAQEMHALIRGLIKEAYPITGQSLKILYGGSMKAASAPELMAQEDIDGGLIGGASLKADEFIGILRAAVASDL
ncbi:triosephosphate isomerase [Thiohalorhabdus denitrificans]|uniref:Triosephosphate isomerase n=1 Tax=Thiohalorhabdus denitrificans TaxID=381306 RepID=A0A0P9C8N1_9GAMM|nr:triose-phosphate isomerase [Thiohalorhabdus denitrificans]KPV41643.1 triosephosphate isomerase [Thiohalorhabdus denitrificans]SCY56612.1 triosephosphate isomerase [Thiohalorhabdus denitrificans]